MPHCDVTNLMLFCNFCYAEPCSSLLVRAEFVQTKVLYAVPQTVGRLSIRALWKLVVITFWQFAYNLALSRDVCFPTMLLIITVSAWVSEWVK